MFGLHPTHRNQGEAVFCGSPQGVMSAQNRAIAGIALIAIGAFAIALEAVTLGTISVLCGVVLLLSALSCENRRSYILQGNGDRRNDTSEFVYVNTNRSSQQSQQPTQAQTSSFFNPQSSAPLPGSSRGQLSDTQDGRGVNNVQTIPLSQVPDNPIAHRSNKTPSPVPSYPKPRVPVALSTAQHPTTPSFGWSSSSSSSSGSQLHDTQAERGVNSTQTIPLSHVPDNKPIGSRSKR